MIKRMVIIGLIILIIGGALFFGGLYTSDQIISHNSHTATSFYNSTSHEYISSNITIKSGYEVLVEGGPSNAGLVNINRLSSVNSTNVNSSTMQPSEHFSNEKVYVGLPSGTYVYVMFNSSKPSVIYEYATLSAVETGGFMVIAGVIAGIAGLAIMIVGTIRKPKKPIKDIYDIDSLDDVKNIK